MKKRKVKLFASIASLGLVVAVMGVGVWAATQQAVKVSSQVSFTATSVAADIKLSVNNAVAPTIESPTPEQQAELAKYADDKEYDIVKEATLSVEMKGSTGDEANQYAKSDLYKHLLYSEKVPTEITEDAENPTNVGKYTEGADIGYGPERAQPRYVARFINDTQKSLFENRVYLNLQDKDEDGYLNKNAQIVYTFTITALESSAPIYYDITADLLPTVIGTTSYKIDEVFDVTVTDTKEELTAPITDTTYGEQSTDTTLDVVHITNWTTGYTGETTSDDNAIQPGETRTITVVYTVKDLTEVDPVAYATYQGIAYTMKSLQLGDIYIKLANNLNNLNQLPNNNVTPGDYPFDEIVDWTDPKDENPFDAIQGPDVE